MPDLSDDAKQVAGGLFGMGPKTKVSFAMIESRPTRRCQAGLDELLAAGLITSKAIPGGGVEYTGSDACREYFRWLCSWRNKADPIRIAEPIKESDHG